MSSDMVLFENEEFGKVRVVEVDRETWFVAKDICDCLGFANHNQTLTRLDDDERGSFEVTHPQSIKKTVSMTIVNESGLYSLVLSSRKHEAKKFKKWITSEVLPSIRKTGSYSATPAYQIPQTYAEALMLAGKLEAERAALADKVEKDAPKVKRTEIVEDSSVTISIADMAKILKQDGHDIGRTRLFAWLRENGYLCTKGQEKNHPTQKAMDLGLFHVAERIRKHDGEDIPYYVVTVTGKGQTYLTKKFTRMEA